MTQTQINNQMLNNKLTALLNDKFDRMYSNKQTSYTLNQSKTRRTIKLSIIDLFWTSNHYKILALQISNEICNYFTSSFDKDTYLLEERLKTLIINSIKQSFTEYWRITIDTKSLNRLLYNNLNVKLNNTSFKINKQ